MRLRSDQRIPIERKQMGSFNRSVCLLVFKVVASLKYAFKISILQAVAMTV